MKLDWKIMAQPILSIMQPTPFPRPEQRFMECTLRNGPGGNIINKIILKIKIIKINDKIKIPPAFCPVLGIIASFSASPTPSFSASDSSPPLFLSLRTDRSQNLGISPLPLPHDFPKIFFLSLVGCIRSLLSSIGGADFPFLIVNPISRGDSSRGWGILGCPGWIEGVRVVSTVMWIDS